jgi:hypothetical protein
LHAQHHGLLIVDWVKYWVLQLQGYFPLTLDGCWCNAPGGQLFVSGPCRNLLAAALAVLLVDGCVFGCGFVLDLARLGSICFDCRLDERTLAMLQAVTIAAQVRITRCGHGASQLCGGTRSGGAASNADGQAWLGLFMTNAYQLCEWTMPAAIYDGIIS